MTTTGPGGAAGAPPQKELGPLPAPPQPPEALRRLQEQLQELSQAQTRDEVRATGQRLLDTVSNSVKEAKSRQELLTGGTAPANAHNPAHALLARLGACTTAAQMQALQPELAAALEPFREHLRHEMIHLTLRGPFQQHAEFSVRVDDQMELVMRSFLKNSNHRMSQSSSYIFKVPGTADHERLILPTDTARKLGLSGSVTVTVEIHSNLYPCGNASRTFAHCHAMA